VIRFEHTVQIGQPREMVYDFLTDVENLPRWQSGVVQSRPISSGPMTPGFQFEETAKVGPWKLRNICTVTEMRPAQRFAFAAKSSGPLDYEGSFDLQPVAGGTRLTVSGSVRLKGLWRLLQPLLAPDLRKETRTEMANLKALLEAGASPVGTSAASGA
jgi:uncharacterized protein YndB with AHSA1/START domain